MTNQWLVTINQTFIKEIQHNTAIMTNEKIKQKKQTQILYKCQVSIIKLGMSKFNNLRQFTSKLINVPLAMQVKIFGKTSSNLSQASTLLQRIQKIDWQSYSKCAQNASLGKYEAIEEG